MKSFLEGRPVVSRTGIVAEDRSPSNLPSIGELHSDAAVATPTTPGAFTPATPVAQAQAPKREQCEKRIETVAVDGVIQKIIVHCSCGERIEVHCGY